MDREAAIKSYILDFCIQFDIYYSFFSTHFQFSRLAEGLHMKKVFGTEAIFKANLFLNKMIQFEIEMELGLLSLLAGVKLS